MECFAKLSRRWCLPGGAKDMKCLWLQMKKSKLEQNDVQEGIKTGLAMELNMSARCLLFEAKMKSRMDMAAGGSGIKSSKSLQGLKRDLKVC